MKTLAIYLLILCSLAGCTATQDDPEPVNATEAHYNFKIASDDNTKFKARITWSGDGLEYIDYITSTGYVSCFDISGEEKFIINVQTSATNLKLFIYPNSGTGLPSKETYITSGVTYTFNSNLD